MAKKPDIKTIASGYYSRQALNSNFEDLRDAFDNTLSLDGSLPNAMGADLDMNSNDILNAKDISASGTLSTEALTLGGTLVSAGDLEAAGAALSTDDHTGDGTTVSFSMSYEPIIAANTQVYIDGVYQNKAGYVVSGTTLTFSEAPPLNSSIEIVVARSLNVSAGSADLVSYNQGDTSAVDRTVESKLQERVSVKDFGAFGDGVADDTAAFQAAIDYCKTSGLVLNVNAGTYKLTDTLDMNDGFDKAVSLVGMGGFSNEPVLEFQDGVDIGILVKNSKNTLIQDLIVDISNVTNDAVAILWYGVWHSKMSNVSVVGGGKTDPASNPTHYGIALRPTYNDTSVTSKTSAVDLEAILSAATATNQGVYWSIFERLDVRNCSYGLTLYGGEGGTAPRTNQNQFNSCKINQNWFNIILDGAGGGNTFISCTAESGGDTAVLVESMSSGTTPIWIGGELNDASNTKWRGQGLLLGAVAGTGFPKANSDGYQGTNFRFSDQGPQLEGQKLTGEGFLSDWNTKQDAPVSGSGVMVLKKFNMVTIEPDTSGSDAIVYELSVVLTDSVLPQGTSIMVYHVLLNRASGQPLSGGVVKISERTEWFNLGGASVAPTVVMSITSDVATLQAKLNWDTTGTNPGNPNVTYKIRQINGVSADDWTLTAL